MTATGSGDLDRLQRSYHRLLITYPRQYRRSRAQEIVSTLLDAAGPQQRRPSVREAVDLLVGGLRYRLTLPRGPGYLAVAVLTALIAGLLGSGAAARVAWISSDVMPTAAEAEAVSREALTGQPVRTIVDDGDAGTFDVLGKSTAPGDEGNTGPHPAPGAIGFEYVTTATEISPVLEPILQRLTGAGWTLGEVVFAEDHAALFWATRGEQLVRVEVLRGRREWDGGSTWSLGDPVTVWLAVHRAAPVATHPAAAGGLLAGALAGWLFAAWVLRAFRRQQARQRLVLAVIGVPALLVGAIGLLIPAALAAIGLAIVDGWSPHDSMVGTIVWGPLAYLVGLAALILAGVAAGTPADR